MEGGVPTRLLPTLVGEVVAMPTQEVAPLQIELRHPPTARYPFNHPRTDEPGPPSPKVAGRPGERDRVGDVLFAPLRSPGVRKLDGAGPFCTGVSKHPNPDGGFLAVAVPPGRGKAGPALEPPVPPPASHVEAQAVLYTVPAVESMVAT